MNKISRAWLEVEFPASRLNVRRATRFSTRGKSIFRLGSVRARALVVSTQSTCEKGAIKRARIAAFFSIRSTTRRRRTAVANAIRTLGRTSTQIPMDTFSSIRRSGRYAKANKSFSIASSCKSRLADVLKNTKPFTISTAIAPTIELKTFKLGVAGMEKASFTNVAIADRITLLLRVSPSAFTVTAGG